MNLYWIGWLVFVVIDLILVIWAIRKFVLQGKQDQKQQDTILQNGVCVVGRIIKYEDEDYASLALGGRGHHTFYHVMYNYEYEGKTYTREQEVPKDIYLAFPDETRVSVHFLPDDPTNVVTNFDVGSSK
jgi:hypothetical protein